MRPEALRLLEDSIADVGVWRTWALSPEAFHVEFGRVQLWIPPRSPEGPPCGVFWLRYEKPWTVNFLTLSGSTLPRDWPRRLQQGGLEPLALSREAFSFTDEKKIRAIVAGAARIETVHGSTFDLDEILSAPVKLAFRAGSAGVVVAAEKLSVRGPDAELAPSGIAAATRNWWTYWRDYWEKKSRGETPPFDPTCEAKPPAVEA
jgi:hypothetical protein